MAELKNTFIQSKMNKDMDGRILPNGQYRNANNVQISKSEGSDVGALENLLGNEFLTDFGLTDPNLEIIGHLMDDTSNTIFLFLTNYTDSSVNQLENSTNFLSQVASYIVSFNTQTNSFSILVQGSFLNFSKTHRIDGVNLLENLLFWTDNRNQPRKINITLAAGGAYYINEDQISVAKYYPYSPISLLDESGETFAYFDSTMEDVVSEYLPIHTAAKVASTPTVALGIATIVLDGVYSNIKPNLGTNNGDLITGLNVGSIDPILLTVVLDQLNSETTITINADDVDEVDADDTIYFQRQNPFYQEMWNGDPDYLKDKFGRFSYRFKFIDGEYSLSAPFTQIAFVPEQDGYFIGNNAPRTGDGVTDPEIKLVGQESAAYDSTVVEFMENKINNINLILESPTYSNYGTSMNWNEVNSLLHVIEIDILFKEASNGNIFILDTLLLEDFNTNTTSTLKYNYQSRKPWKVLPERELTRVSDKVPIRSKAQEVAGNRVIYGNYIDKHSSPVNLDYSVQVNEKPVIPTVDSTEADRSDKNLFVRKEYQNHTLKQNRTYQVGLVLMDRYGRQSNVILSSVFDANSPVSGDTIYHPYRSVDDQIINDHFNDGYLPGNEVIPSTWPGDQLNVIFYNIIPEEHIDGYPGTYGIRDGSVAELIINPLFNGSFEGPCGPFNVAIVNTLGDPIGNASIEVDSFGNVIILNFVQTPGYIASEGEAWNLSWGTQPDPGAPCNENFTKSLSGNIKLIQDQQLGWYSYKVVVKQTEQEYYNIYLPGSMAGYPCDQTGADPGTPEGFPRVDFDFPKGQYKDTCHVVLFGDNINKLPRDLTEVGPSQEKFRSSVRLFGRVENFIDEPSGANESWSSRQYDPENKWDIAVTIGKMTELGLGDLILNPVDKTIPPLFYQGDTDPLIARIKTRNDFGQKQRCSGGDPYPYGPCLAIYETEPVESKLEIFWETTTSGLIEDLNKNILTVDNTIPTGITNAGITWSEADGFGDYISNTFEAADSNGNGIGPLTQIELTSVIRADGAIVSQQFELEEQGVGTGEYKVKIAPHDFTNNPGFLCWEDGVKNNYTFYFEITRDDGISVVTTITTTAVGTVVNETPVPRGALASLDHGQGLKNNIFSNFAVMYSENEIPAIHPGNGTACDDGPCSGAAGVPAYGRVSTNDSVSGGFYRRVQFDFGNDIFLDHKIRSRLDSESTSAYGPSPSGWQCEGVSWGCGEKTQTIDYPWAVFDGKFEAASGAYGSNVVFPPSSFVGKEIEYSIPRMYQVSCIGMNPYFATLAPTCPAFECVFGLDYSGASWTPQQIAWFGGIQSLVPDGPIYWNFDPTLDQQDFAKGGEEIVGQRYNGVGFVHYWKDLSDIITAQNPVWIAAGMPVATAPNAVKIKQGYNSFYSANGNGTDQSGTFIPDIPPTMPANAGGYGGYLGGLDSSGIGPADGLMKFFAVTEPLITNSNGTTSPRVGYIHAGNPNFPVQALQTRTASWTTTSLGNTIPGGRYVVTLRATDKTSVSPANPSGLYYEWDVPITISGVTDVYGITCYDLYT